MKKLLALLLAALSTSLAAPTAQAQPAKPLRIVMPGGAGGPSDVAARALGQSLSKALGQPVVIDNRPGANGVLAAQALTGAPTDGSVLLWALASMATIPMVQKSPPFASLADFAPVSLVAVNVFGVFVHPSVPANTLGDLATHLRANPDKLAYASGTLAEYFASVRFLHSADARALRVPYRSGMQALQDLLVGRVQFHLAPLGLGLPHVKDGKLRLLAVLASERSPLAPDVPTTSEAGFPNVIVPTWQSLVAPAGTPKAVTERLAREVEMALRDPALRAQLEQIGMQVRGQGPDALAATIARDTEVWRTFVRENDIGPE